jgi:hypothetical protein
METIDSHAAGFTLGVSIMQKSRDQEAQGSFISIRTTRDSLPVIKSPSGVMKGLPADSFEVFSYFMDTKRNPAEAFTSKRELKSCSIRSGRMNPDLLIVSDDNAMKYLVVPNFQDDPLPIVFCGVNWTVDQYDISDCNITGVLEILPIAEG